MLLSNGISGMVFIGCECLLDLTALPEIVADPAGMALQPTSAVSSATLRPK